MLFVQVFFGSVVSCKVEVYKSGEFNDPPGPLKGYNMFLFQLVLF